VSEKKKPDGGQKLKHSKITEKKNKIYTQWRVKQV